MACSTGIRIEDRTRFHQAILHRAGLAEWLRGASHSELADVVVVGEALMRLVVEQQRASCGHAP